MRVITVKHAFRIFLLCKHWILVQDTNAYTFDGQALLESGKFLISAAAELLQRLLACYGDQAPGLWPNTAGWERWRHKQCEWKQKPGEWACVSARLMGNHKRQTAPSSLLCWLLQPQSGPHTAIYIVPYTAGDEEPQWLDRSAERTEHDMLCTAFMLPYLQLIMVYWY